LAPCDDTEVSTRDDERQLWQHGQFSCVMISCCAGAELQVRHTHRTAESDDIVLRELYPSKSDLYERARELAEVYSTATANVGTDLKTPRSFE